MDIVIPLGSGSRWHNEELRYALRSIGEYAENVDEVYIIGEKPSWLQNVIHIPFVERDSPTINVKKKIELAGKEIGKPFLVSNDDIFFTQETDITQIPYYRKQATLRERMGKVHRLFFRTPYGHALCNTTNVLEKGGYTNYHFGVHAPYIVDPVLFDEVMGKFIWDRSQGYFVRSLYANMLGIEGVETKDPKIVTRLGEAGLRKVFDENPFVSVGDSGLTFIFKRFLRRRYPNMSKYESTDTTRRY